MAEPVDWEETDLQRLISDGVGESLTLDYKAAAALTPRTESIKKEIGKDVSAFSNSAGGRSSTDLPRPIISPRR